MSDWSSDGCSSDLLTGLALVLVGAAGQLAAAPDSRSAAVADGVDFARHRPALGLRLLQRQRERGEPGQHLFALRAVAGAFGQVGAGGQIGMSAWRDRVER